MVFLEGSAKKTENSFVIHTKVGIKEGYFQFPDEFPLPEKHAAKMAFLLVNGGIEPLSTEIVQAYERDFKVDALQSGDVFSIVPANNENKILIYSHETGPEVFLLPIASFLAGTALSGIIGNLAYDILKDLYQKSFESLKKSIQEWNNRATQIDKINEEEMLNALEIRLVTPEGNIVVHFDKEKGLPSELVEYLNRRIKYYQESHPNK